MTRRQATTIRAAAQAWAKQEARDATLRGVQHPSQWGAWAAPPSSRR
jgi:rhodanese-related sulfurtransferase